MRSERVERRCELCGTPLAETGSDWWEHRKRCPALKDVERFVEETRAGVRRLREKWGDRVLDEVRERLAIDVVRNEIYAAKYSDLFAESDSFGRLPAWFWKALRKYEAERVGKRKVEVVLLDFQWWDHVKRTRDGKVVAEPYKLTMEGAEQLLDFCRKTGLRFVITGDSFHYPTWTLRIAIYPPNRQ